MKALVVRDDAVAGSRNLPSVELEVLSAAGPPVDQDDGRGALWVENVVHWSGEWASA